MFQKSREKEGNSKLSHNISKVFSDESLILRYRHYFATAKNFNTMKKDVNVLIFYIQKPNILIIFLKCPLSTMQNINYTNSIYSVTTARCSSAFQSQFWQTSLIAPISIRCYGTGNYKDLWLCKIGHMSRGW